MMTQITGLLHEADGTLANGTAVISWTAFSTHEVVIVGGQKLVDIVDGQFSVELYPTISAFPKGMYYTVRMELESGSIYEEYWIVPDLPAVTIEQVRSMFPVEPGMFINPNQIAGSGAEPGMLLVWNGSYWEGSYAKVDNIDPNWIRVETGSSGTDFWVDGSPVSLGKAVTIHIPSASPTARGLVTTGAQTFGGSKTFSGSIQVDGAITGPTITDIYTQIDAAEAAAVPVTRQIIAGAGLSGGGPLSADVTLMANVRSVFGRTGDVAAQNGDYTAAQVTNAVSVLGSYADPAWITSIGWAKVAGAPSTFPPSPHQHPWSDITGTPATFPPSAHQHAAADVTSGVFAVARLGTGSPGAGNFLRGDGVWSTTPNTGHVIQEEGAGLTARGALNFVGEGVLAQDDPANNRTNVIITGGGGGGSQTPWLSDIDANDKVLFNLNRMVIGTPGPSDQTGTPGPIEIWSVLGSEYVHLHGVNMTLGIKSFRQNGTTAVPTAVLMYEGLLQLSGHGYDGSAHSGRSANMYYFAAENWTPAAHGSYIVFETTALGSTTPVERVRITEAGFVGINKQAPSNHLHIAFPVSPGITLESTSTPGDGASISGIAFASGDGTNANVVAATINARANGAWTASNHGTDIQFRGTSNGSTALTEWVRMRNGRVGIGTPDPPALLSLYNSTAADFTMQYGGYQLWWMSADENGLLKIGGNGGIRPTLGAININTIGAVGIGTKNPLRPLHVSKNQYCEVLIEDNNVATATIGRTWGLMSHAGNLAIRAGNGAYSEAYDRLILYGTGSVSVANGDLSIPNGRMYSPGARFSDWMGFNTANSNSYAVGPFYNAESLDFVWTGDGYASHVLMLQMHKGILYFKGKLRINTGDAQLEWNPSPGAGFWHGISTNGQKAFVGLDGNNPVWRIYASGIGNVFSINLDTQGANFSGSVTAPTFIGSLSGNASSANSASSVPWSGVSGKPNVMIVATQQSISGATTVAGHAAHYAGGAFEIRELGFAGSVGGDMYYWPHIGFHWSGLVGSCLGMANNGEIQCRNNPGTDYEHFRAKDIYAMGGASVAGNCQAASYNGCAIRSNNWDAPGPNQILRTDKDNYLGIHYTSYWPPIDNPNPIGKFIVSNAGDNFMRWATWSHVNSLLTPQWTNVQGRPTNVSSFSNDSGYITGGYGGGVLYQHFPVQAYFDRNIEVRSNAGGAAGGLIHFSRDWSGLEGFNIDVYSDELRVHKAGVVKLTIRSNGRIKLTDATVLPTYASDTAAQTGGLVAGELYKNWNGSAHAVFIKA